TSTGSNPPEGSSKRGQDSSNSRVLSPFRGPPREDAMHAHEGHTHPHPTLPDADAPPTYYQRLETALRELLISRGAISAADLRRKVEVIDSQTPALGARVVARAWVDPAYKARLLADGSAAVQELGIPMEGVLLVVVENTPAVHNLIVCTLCSCYPRPVLGLPP